MEIYRLVQNTWQDTQLGDFDLPRTIGHYSSREKAENVMIRLTHDCINRDATTERDYQIDKIVVL